MRVRSDAYSFAFSILPMMLEFTRGLLNKNSRAQAPAVMRYLGNDLSHSH
jgi:hypothetical protein